MFIKYLIPKKLRRFLRASFYRLFCAKAKYKNELAYWKGFIQEGFDSSRPLYYKKIMLAIAEENDDSFTKDKIVADFGCGPEGTLTWAQNAKLRIGIDVLVEQYMGFDIKKHNMCYIGSTEKSIPLPSGYVDIIYSINSLDHVNRFEAICKELFRILASGGTFLGSFNLNRRPTFCEPTPLNEKIIQRDLLRYLNVQSYRLALTYENLLNNKLENKYDPDKEFFLWVKAVKP